MIEWKDGESTLRKKSIWKLKRMEKLRSAKMEQIPPIGGILWTINQKSWGMRTILKHFISNIRTNLKRKKKEKRLAFNMKRQRLMLILRVLLFNIKISLSLPRKSLVLLQISILENNSFLKKRDNIARSLKSRIKSGKMQRRRKLKKRRNKRKKRKKRKGNKRKKRKSKNYLYQLHK